MAAFPLPKTSYVNVPRDAMAVDSCGGDFGTTGGSDRARYSRRPLRRSQTLS
jgi:hypothetical protein